MIRKIIRSVTLIPFCLFSTLTLAGLEARDLDGNFDNGHEAVYDDILNITWLADANLAESNSFGVTGINAHGEMYWDTAESFIQAMNQTNLNIGYLGINTWRQSKVAPLNGTSFDTSVSYDGSTDSGYQLGATVSEYNPWGASAGFTGSEFAYHYYQNFGGIADCFGIGLSVPGCNPTNLVGINNAGNTENLSLFSNIKSWPYWTDTQLPANPNKSFAFNFSDGNQDAIDKNTDIVLTRVRQLKVWPVTDGDVGTPIPASDILEIAVPIPLFAPAVLFIVFGLIILRRLR